ncbi:hypothetical protein EUX98_g7916 [Antrodiella citrinella]|uniref:Uncharacterized protein n=1 Tax=Antrodiella citrinella TaxID=2447956 RepID=A0A4V3XGZ0_9APHY|nr:hypothetical protein EUX98_g7916 [Antrodiella citrinella]
MAGPTIKLPASKTRAKQARLSTPPPSPADDPGDVDIDPSTTPDSPTPRSPTGSLSPNSRIWKRHGQPWFDKQKAKDAEGSEDMPKTDNDAEESDAEDLDEEGVSEAEEPQEVALPPPRPRKRGRPPKASQTEQAGKTTVPESTPKRARRGTTAKPPKPAVDNTPKAPAFPHIILQIPSGRGGVGLSERVPLPYGSSFEDAQETIYKTLGCDEVHRKPALIQYKLSTSTKNAPAFALRDAGSWDLLVADVQAAEAKRKTQVPVDISVGHLYLESLRSKLNAKKTPGKGKTTSGRGAKKKKQALMDLDADSDVSDEITPSDDEEEMSEEQKKWMLALRAELSSCQLCKAQKLCKLDKQGRHINVTWSQLRVWAIALAVKTHAVTLKSPPKTEHFVAFHNPAVTVVPAQPSVAPPESAPAAAVPASAQAPPAWPPYPFPYPPMFPMASAHHGYTRGCHRGHPYPYPSKTRTRVTGHATSSLAPALISAELAMGWYKFPTEFIVADTI